MVSVPNFVMGKGRLTLYFKVFSVNTKNFFLNKKTRNPDFSKIYKNYPKIKKMSGNCRKSYLLRIVCVISARFCDCWVIFGKLLRDPKNGQIRSFYVNLEISRNPG